MDTTPDRLQQIEELFQAVRERAPGEREALLATADPEVRLEVESLLAQRGDALLDRPVSSLAASEATTVTQVAVGTQFGPYTVETMLGRGGMGEVYRARDTRLNRAVAIKVASHQFTDRFEREARAIAAVNHPHICTLYDVGPNYLVMELVEGETLAARLKKGKLSFPQTLQYGQQIADALAAAHARGITHRDLKPGNIMITKSGIKVLDFGLAKLAQDQTVTAADALMGTPAYMAPEQREGKECDARTDIYALGLVLQEMALGKGILEPAGREDLPPHFAHILERCLTPDPESRWQAASDVKAELEWTTRTEGAVGIQITRRRPLPWAVAVAFAVAFTAVFLLYFRAAPPDTRVTYNTVSPPENTSLDWNAPVPSPDGRSVALWASGERGLWVRRLDSSAAQPLPGTEHAILPFWSPDSRSLGFFADGKLKRIEVTGGPAVTLAEAPSGFGGSWSPRGVIVFAPTYTGVLHRVAATGGATSPATALAGTDDYSHRLPRFLPDGKHFLFEDHRSVPGDSTLQIGVLDSRDVKTVGRGISNGAFSHGYLLYLRENALMAQPFDPIRLTVSGDAIPIAQHVPSLAWYGAPVGEFSVSGELVAYKTGPEADQLQLTWFDRNGKQVGTLGEASTFSSLEFSPDHTSLAVSRTVGNSDIWIYEVARGLPARFTSPTGLPEGAVWSPDGRTIAYALTRNGTHGLYRKALDGSGNEELLYDDAGQKFPASWSPDGRYLLFWRIDPKAGFDLWALPLKRGVAHGFTKPFQWLATAFNELPGRFSPDGRWVAYFSDESNPLYEVYVAPFPGSGPKRQISAGGGRQPRWRADSKEIFYVTPNGELMAAEVSLRGTNIEVGAVRSLGIRPGATSYLYDVSADGQRILAAVPVEQKASSPLTLVENWTELLKKK